MPFEGAEQLQAIVDLERAPRLEDALRAFEPASAHASLHAKQLSEQRASECWCAGERLGARFRARGGVVDLRRKCLPAPAAAGRRLSSGAAARDGACVRPPRCHLLFPGGKRLRPPSLAAAEAVGARRERALAVAVAVNLLALADDTCMDDDACARGRPTVHVVYGEATAVLAGDALLTPPSRH
jgi:hypothetical protein